VSETLVTEFREARRNPDLVVLEGFHALKHAVRFDASIVLAVTADRGGLQALTAGLAPDLTERLAALVTEVHRDTFRELAPQEPHTGVLAVARRPVAEPGGGLSSLSMEDPIVGLEDPRNLGNLGAVVRVAAAAGAAAVLTTGVQDPWDPVALRGSAGLHFALPVMRVGRLAAAGRPLVAMDPDGDIFAPTELPRSSLVAFGTEREGLSKELCDAADFRFRLPMRPGVSSLNLATSVAAVLFAWRLAGASPS
jgi:TrmH family RNA methyltransferase